MAEIGASSCSPVCVQPSGRLGGRSSLCPLRVSSSVSSRGADLHTACSYLSGSLLSLGSLSLRLRTELPERLFSSPIRCATARWGWHWGWGSYRLPFRGRGRCGGLSRRAALSWPPPSWIPASSRLSSARSVSALQSAAASHLPEWRVGPLAYCSG